MRKKNKRKNKTLLIGIIAIIILLIYAYLANLTVKKIDNIFVPELDIFNINIDDEYIIDDEGISPILTIKYNVSKNTSSYIVIGNITTKEKQGNSFLEKINLDKSFFGKELNVIIVINSSGAKKEINKKVYIDNPAVPVITVTS